LSILSHQAVEIVRLGDGISVDSNHAELSLSTFCREVGESDASAPGVGHRAREQGSDLSPETRRRGDTPVLAEVGSNVITREVTVLCGIGTRRSVTTPLAVKILMGRSV
jgi:hypothetical protein